MTVVITYLASDNARNRRRDRRAAEYDKKRTVTGCRNRVEQALRAPNWRILPDTVDGAMCLPDVALYAAGHRKSESVTAR
nr:hypothetical protein [uncultured Erwinia sp.]